MKPFKIWCETEKEKRAVLEKMEREGIRWCNTAKPTYYMRDPNYKAPIGLCIDETGFITRVRSKPIFFKHINKRYSTVSVCDYLCKSEKFIIYRDGRKVITLDKRTGEKAEARCNPSDTFDFNIGARLAFDRLIPNKEPASPEPKEFTGRAVFIGTKTFYDTDFTIGRIYSFSDGKVKDDGGDLRPISPQDRFGATRNLSEWGFLPIVE